MTYRDAEYREACLACGTDAEVRCARCDGPSCVWHLSSEDQVCQVCEAGYLQQQLARRDPAVGGKAIAIAVAVAALTYVIVPIQVFGLGLGVAAALAAAIGHHVEVGRRRRQLTRRRRRGLAAPP